MKPTALTLLLFCVSMLCLGVLTGRSEAVYDPDGSSASEIQIGPGPALRFVETVDADGRRSSGTVVSWPHLLLCFAAGYLAARGIASLLERRRRGRPFAVLAGVCGVTLLLAALAVMAFSIDYWGYAYARPAPDDLVEDFAAVTGLSRVDCALTGGPPRCALTAAEPVWDIVSHCQKDPYYCLDGRAVFALYRRGLPPADFEPAPAAAARPLEGFLARTGLLATAAPGYEVHSIEGLVVTGRSATGAPLTAACVSSGQVSNDHYPQYEILLGGDRPLVQRRFFYDVAGSEGFEGWRAILGVGILGLAVSVPATLLVLGLLAAIAAVAARKRGGGPSPPPRDRQASPSAPTGRRG